MHSCAFCSPTLVQLLTAYFCRLHVQHMLVSFISTESPPCTQLKNISIRPYYCTCLKRNLVWRPLHQAILPSASSPYVVVESTMLLPRQLHWTTLPRSLWVRNPVHSFHPPADVWSISSTNAAQRSRDLLRVSDGVDHIASNRECILDSMWWDIVHALNTRAQRVPRHPFVGLNKWRFIQ